MKANLLNSVSLVFTLTCASAVAANYSYLGAGADPNDWFDGANWSVSSGVTNYPTAADNALFTGAGLGMTISQDLSGSPISQLQVGRGNDNTVVIGPGGKVVNLNQTVVGITGGKGTLLVSGGTLTTVHLRLGLDAGAVSPAGSSVTISGGLIDVNKDGAGAKGNIEVGFHRTSLFTLQGGAVSTETDFDFYRGTVSILGAAGSLAVGGSFDFGTGAGPTELRFELDGSGSVSTVFADAFSLAGPITLSLDGSAAAPAGPLTLFSLATDTFSPGELSALQSALSLTGVSGSLQLQNAGRDLVFLVPEPSALALLGLGLGAFLIRRRS